MTIDPTGDDIRRFVDEDDGEEVVMLNLLRFAGDSGKASYAEYMQRVQPFIDKVGASVVYVGETSTTLVAADGHDWDAVLLVRYPNRQAFLAMVFDEEYQQITHLRSDGLEAAVLQATSQWRGQRP